MKTICRLRSSSYTKSETRRNGQNLRIVHKIVHHTNTTCTKRARIVPISGSQKFRVFSTDSGRMEKYAKIDLRCVNRMLGSCHIVGLVKINLLVQNEAKLDPNLSLCKHRTDTRHDREPAKSESQFSCFFRHPTYPMIAHCRNHILVIWKYMIESTRGLVTVHKKRNQAKRAKLENRAQNRAPY